MQLAELAAGQRGIISGLSQGNRSYRQRLLAMGVTPGTPFTVVRVAPLGDPYEITVRGYTLTLRKHEAALLEVALHEGDAA
ncbi:FeoA family protein [Chitinilyticum piscinae]|uniref:Ferrous iron transport protein A n=1 Tax=Chitinilyticum piscinae TaxID=2866724 RepID=A0A8J7FFZ2_9NEIS|nr:FeoA family protein [Chitinilyticum piscinae]MBE9608350.1 ferrous iron transport protein A [Chitinilyticum piscinae]